MSIEESAAAAHWWTQTMSELSKVERRLALCRLRRRLLEEQVRVRVPVIAGDRVSVEVQTAVGDVA